MSGQIPEAADGTLPADFEGQARQAWANVSAQLAAAGMSLADRRHAAEDRRIRTEMLAGRPVALTVVIAGIFDERWMIEIEAIAVT